MQRFAEIKSRPVFKPMICALSAAIALGLSACGGGDGAGASATFAASTQPSESVTFVSSDAMVAAADSNPKVSANGVVIKKGPMAMLNPVGVNMVEPITWGGFPVFTDAIHEARPFQTPSGAAAKLDANGWPIEDFQVILFEGGFQQWLVGTWTGSFTGKGSVTPYGAVTISGVAYNSSTNTTTFNMIAASNVTGAIGFNVTGTSKGAQNVSMRRPNESSLTGTFRPEATAWLGQFAYIRYMWFQDVWYDTTQTSWSTRTTTSLRTTPAYQTGQGQALEQAIALTNASKTGGWFHIPINADDDYVTQTANMLRDTLSAGLPAYVELGNEIWNGSAPLYNISVSKALAYNTAHPGVLNYDGETNQTTLADRWVAMRTKEISVLFQSSFGSTYQSRVRVVLANQLGWTRLSNMLTFVKKIYGNPSSYFYAISTAPYVTIDNSQFGGKNDTNNMSLTTQQTLADLSTNSANMMTWGLVESTSLVAKKYGLKFVAYEGGPALSSGFAPATSAVGAAGMDPNMQPVVEDMLTRSYNAGMESFAFFEGGVEKSSPYGSRFTLSDNYQALVQGTAPKMKALTTFLTRGKPVPTRNVVSAPGAVIDARGFADHSVSGNYPKFNAGTWVMPPDVNQQGNIPYLINCTVPGTYTLTLNVTTTGSAATNLEVNGVSIFKGVAIPNTGGAAANVVIGAVTLTSGTNYILLGNGTYQAQVQLNSLKF